MRTAAVMAIVATAGIAHASVITQWNFNSVEVDGSFSTGTLVPNIGAGTASVVGGITDAGFFSGSANGGSTDPVLSPNNSAWQTTDYPTTNVDSGQTGVQFNVSTAGASNIVVSWDQRHSNTSSRWVGFQYSTNGTDFIDFAIFEGNNGDTWFNNRTVDLTGVAGVDNNADFAFRIVAIFAPGTSEYAASRSTSNFAGGTWRFDMVTVVPAPGAMALLGLGGLVAARRRRA